MRWAIDIDRLVRWAVKLSGYDYDIKYKAGRYKPCADAL